MLPKRSHGLPSAKFPMLWLIMIITACSELFAVNAETGKPIRSFGSGVSEEEGAAPGYIRAFNIRTGRLVWVFHTIPKPGEFGYDSWPAEAWKTAGASNSGAGGCLCNSRCL